MVAKIAGGACRGWDLLVGMEGGRVKTACT